MQMIATETSIDAALLKEGESEHRQLVLSYWQIGTFLQPVISQHKKYHK